MEKIPENTLKRIYYQSSADFHLQDEILFEIGDVCQSIYVVMQGAIEIILSDGNISQPLDILGRGSILGSNNVILAK